MHITIANVVVVVYDLDLSDCQLVQVPDAVYHLMRNTELRTCDLSSNVIKKIQPKFAIKFSLITGMHDKTLNALDPLTLLPHFLKLHKCQAS